MIKNSELLRVVISNNLRWTRKILCLSLVHLACQPDLRYGVGFQLVTRYLADSYAINCTLQVHSMLLHLPDTQREPDMNIVNKLENAIRCRS